MNKIDKLIKEKCPNGVEYKKVWEVTAWDKKYNAVDNKMQPKIIKYNYLLANELDEITVDEGDVFILETGINSIKKYTTEKLAGRNLCEGEVVAIPWGGTPNVKYYKGKFVTGDNRIATSIDINILSNKFLYYVLDSKMTMIKEFYRGSGIKHPEMKKILLLDIPIPPIEIQNEIIKILDKFNELKTQLEVEREERKKQYKFWCYKLYQNKNIEYKFLNEISINCDSKRRAVTKGKRNSGEYPYYGASGIVDYVDDYIYEGEYLLISEDGANLIARSTPIAFSIQGKNWVNNHAHVLKFENKFTQKYVEYYLNSIDLKEYITGAAQPKLNQDNLNKIPIPIPSKEEQEKTVNILNKFDKLINDLKEGLPAEIELRRKQYEYYRNKLLNFKEVIN